MEMVESFKNLRIENLFQFRCEIDFVQKILILNSIIFCLWFPFVQEPSQRLLLVHAIATLLTGVAVTAKKNNSVCALVFFIGIMKLILIVATSSDIFWWAEGLFLAQDSTYYNMKADFVISELSRGDIVIPAELQKRYGNNGSHYSYLLGFFYYFFGKGGYQIVVLNLIFQMLTAKIIFSIGREIHNEKLGISAATFYLCAPAMNHWMLFGLKECFLTMIFMGGIYFVILITESGLTLIRALMLFLIMYVAFIDRIYTGFFILLSIFLTYIFSKSNSKKIIRITLGLMCFFPAIYLLVRYGGSVLLSLLQEGMTSKSSMLYGVSMVAYPALLLKIMITPLPFSVSITTSPVNILQGFHFFYNLLITFFSISSWYLLWKKKNKLFYVFSIYICYLLIWAVIAPGYNRTRDNFFPLLCVYSVMWFYLIDKNKSLRDKTNAVY